MIGAVRAALLLALCAAMPASACTIFWVPYLKHRPKDLYAVRVKSASVSFSRHAATTDPKTLEVSGTLSLRGIKCLSRPQGVRTCPADLDIGFELRGYDENCPFYAATLRPDEPVTDRYFYLRQTDGKWHADRGARSLDQL